MNQSKRKIRARRKAKSMRLQRWNGVPSIRSLHVVEWAR
jgi:hypothetical protein